MIGAVVTGVLGGIGVLVLLQQFAVAYPTRLLSLLVPLGFVAVNVLAAAGTGRRRRGGAAAVAPAEAVVAEPVTEPEPEPEPAPEPEREAAVWPRERADDERDLAAIPDIPASPASPGEPEPEPEPATATAAETEWVPTHAVPEAGLAAYAEPDPAAAPVARLDPRLPVAVVDRLGDWARIVCSNGWSAWVDSRTLVEERT